jgi:hypothetical protein
MTDRRMEEFLRFASPEDLTRAALTHNTFSAQVASSMTRLEEVNREGVE